MYEEESTILRGTKKILFPKLYTQPNKYEGTLQRRNAQYLPCEFLWMVTVFCDLLG